MDIELKNRIQTKFFIGCLITPDLYRQLNGNADYQSAKISATPDRLIEIDYKHKHYLGRYCETSPCSMAALKLLEEDVAQKIARISPTFNTRPHPLHLFSQLFIT